MNEDENLKKDALLYHSSGRKGKIEVIPTKGHSTQRDLALAYSPGVAEPCKAIAEHVEKVYDYTAKGNLVAVISNGTAVLGLGDIGPEASKPVMEGKGLLFKTFADIDVFDIEINEKDPKKFIEIVKGIAPTFGGINLEDIKAPEAFEIEQTLKEELNIPVMHDDQHGTAIISGAALINALSIAKKNIEEVKIVVNGAGAAAIACTKIYVSLGANPNHILMCDSKGVISTKREDLNEEKKSFARDTNDVTLEDAMHGADVFIGLSVADCLTPEMLNSMTENPIVFAMANPNPEIDYNLAIKTRKDVIMATGRSDFPNQVNNVLGFPFIFRGALDVRAISINEEMKLAAVKALADLAKEPVPEMVLMAYNEDNLSFGREYIIPKPFDNRLITKVSMAVAQAAMESGVAQYPIKDWKRYEEQLLARSGKDHKLIRMLQNRARSTKKRIVLNNGEDIKMIKAAQIIQDENIAEVILLGDKKQVIGAQESAKKVSGLMMLLTKKGPLFFADTTIIVDPDWKDLVRIARMTAKVVRGMGLMPRMAMLSFENFSGKNEISVKMAKAVEFLHQHFPEMIVDGEVQPDFALNIDNSMEDFPFSKLHGKAANVLIFPNLASGNLSYKILRGIEGAQTIGPILMGLNKPVHILQMHSSVEEIVNLATIAVLDAQLRK
ncbi:unnamed protein product [Cyprideis torosa]|uniref:Uncharacterized protein n=1 Tax=Cyprideis torosa TaxID=163714 RepID=A0A7R8WA18_9CRUS|nr:unnamed protein product [Cyprideis torosa]CAG0890414.1 unnamed protein product [Cyprideis torosa]